MTGSASKWAPTRHLNSRSAWASTLFFNGFSGERSAACGRPVNRRVDSDGLRPSRTLGSVNLPRRSRPALSPRVRQRAKWAPLRGRPGALCDPLVNRLRGVVGLGLRGNAARSCACAGSGGGWVLREQKSPAISRGFDWLDSRAGPQTALWAGRREHSTPGTDRDPERTRTCATSRAIRPSRASASALAQRLNDV